MKKLSLVLGAIAILTTAPVFAEEAIDANKPQTLPCPIEKSIKIEIPQDAQMKQQHRPPHFDINKFENELGLTDKQKAQAKEIREKSKEQAKAVFEQLKAKEKEMGELKKQLRDIREQSKKDFEAILTSKQVKKLEALKQERKQKFEERRSKMGKKHHRGCKCDCGCKRPPHPPVEPKVAE